MPLKVSGMISQSGRRSSAVTSSAAHTASPITGMLIEQVGIAQVGDHIGQDGDDQDREHDERRAPNGCARPARTSLMIGE